MIIKSSDKKALIEKKHNTEPYYIITNNDIGDIDTSGYNKTIVPVGTRYKSLTISKHRMQKVKKERPLKATKQVIVKPLSSVLQEDVRLGIY